MKKIVIYSHRVDNDGYASAAIMNMFFPEYLKRLGIMECEITNIPWTYGDKEPIFEDFEGYDYVIVVDLHFDNKLTFKLKNYFGDNFIWFDHHAQCIQEYEDFCNEIGVDPYVVGIQSKMTYPNNKICYSAAELCWYWLFGREENDRCNNEKLKSLIPYRKIPKVIELISDFDVWNKESNNSWDEEIYPFQMGSRTYIKSYMDMMNLLYHELYNENVAAQENSSVNRYINEGKIIINYENTECLKDIRSGAFIETFVWNDREYKACVLNTTKRSSNVFVNMPDRDDYDVFICYNIIKRQDNYQYRYSMYAFKDDVKCAGMIINGIKFNGHDHACGAQSKYFIFDNEY